MVIPVDRLPEVAKISVDSGLHLNRILRVKGTPRTPVKRVLIHLDKKYREVEMGEMTLESEDRGYWTEEYRGMTAGFYLDN